MGIIKVGSRKGSKRGVGAAPPKKSTIDGDVYRMSWRNKSGKYTYGPGYAVQRRKDLRQKRFCIVSRNFGYESQYPDEVTVRQGTFTIPGMLFRKRKNAEKVAEILASDK